MPEPKSLPPRSAWLALAGALFVVGVWLRFAGLDRLELFVDEGGHILAPVDADVRRAIDPLGEGKPGIAWFFAPAGWTSDPLPVARAMVAACGLVTALALAATLRLLLGGAAAIIGLGLWLLLPFAVFHERLALFDPVMATAFATGLLLLVLGSRPETSARARLGWSAAGGLVLGSAVLLKISALLAAPWLLLVYAAVQRHQRQPLLSRRLAVTAAAWVLPAAVLYLAAPGLGQRILHPVTPPAPVDGWPILRWYAGYGQWALGLALAVAAAVAWGRRVSLAGWLGLAWLVSVIVAELAYPLPYARYVLPDHVTLVLFLAVGLAHAPRWLVLPTLAAVLGGWLFVDVRLQRDPRTAPLPREEIAQYVTGVWSGEGSRAVIAELERRAPCVVFVHRYSRPGSYAVLLAMRQRPTLGAVALSIEAPQAIAGARSIAARARTLLGSTTGIYLLAEGAPPPEPVLLEAGGVRSQVVLDYRKADGASHLVLLRCEL